MAVKTFYLTLQGSNEGIDEYFARFETAEELVQPFDEDVIDTDELLKTEKVVNQKATEETVTQKYFAMCLVMNGNRNKYESLWNKLENDLLMEQDSYPTTLSAATQILTN